MVVETGVVSKMRCPRCSSRRVAGMDRCAKCDWRFEHAVPPAPEDATGSVDRPMIARPIIVELSPDPFSRRQVARWLVSVFEVVVPTAVMSTVAGWFGVLLAAAVSQALGNDLAGTALSALVWGPAFALIGAYVSLRLFAHE